MNAIAKIFPLPKILPAAAALLALAMPAAPAALNITPRDIVTAPGKTVKLSIPRDTEVHSNDPAVAKISPDGALLALAPGRAMLSFRKGADYAQVAVTIRQKPPAPFPKTDDTHPVDAAVNKNLRDLGVPPSPLCNDSEYLRRVCLDLMGALPPVEVTTKFLDDTDPEKRARLVDWIFTRPEYADYWAMKWCDVLRVKSEFPSNLWPNAVQSYHAWLRETVATNMPYDKMARALLTTGGSNFRTPPGNFYRATPDRSPAGLATNFAVIFLGARIDGETRLHPYETWTPAQSAALAAFFTTVQYKNTDEWKEEIVFFRPWSSYRPDGPEAVAPVLPDGTPVPFSRQTNPQIVLADWLAKPGNPWFARHIADRYWCALFGRGITLPVDDVRPSNPPSNPELLDLLAQKVISSGYDLQALLRFIVTSQTYQRSSLASNANRADTQNWSHYIPSRLDAEVLADAIGAATGTYETFTSRIPEPFAMWPDDFHSVQNPDASVSSGFLETFGRPGRDSSYEIERDRNPSMPQALYLFVSDALARKLAKKDGTVRAIAQKHDNDDAGFVREYYLMLLCRPPTDAERDRVTAYMKNAPDKNKAAQDVVWALLNTKEFLYNH